MANEIVYLNVKDLISHPDNPRFAVGDVTELAASLKAKGCLQNLTVVPRTLEQGKYLVVIGNRRLAAAKLAGIETLPCAITDMSRQEQIETMLLENMQRADLTLYEEACGIQMMMDEFGCTVADIAEKTGLSLSTVRRRKKLTELDRDTMQELDKQVKAGEKQITLDDYISVAELETEPARKRALKAIGTSSFNFEVNTAKRAQEITKVFGAFIDKLEAAGYSETNSTNNLKFFRYINEFEGAELPELPEGTRGFYVSYDTGYIQLYRSLSNEELTEQHEQERKLAEQEAERDKNKERFEQIKELSVVAYRTRCEFVKNFYPNTRHIKTVVKFASVAIICDDLDVDFLDMVLPRQDEDETEIDDYTCSELDKFFEDKPLHALLAVAFAAMDNISNNYIKPGDEHSENELLDYIYSVLCELGYEMSDTEKQLQDGTHPLFKEE